RVHSDCLLSSSVPPRALPSFPTRRSSDLHSRRRDHFAAELLRRSNIDQRHARRRECLEDVVSKGTQRRIRFARAIRRASVRGRVDRKSTRLDSSHVAISYAVLCLKKKKLA